MIYSIENLSFSYTSGSAPVLNDVCLSVGSGDILSVLGRNGAGKSTLLGCMMGLLNPRNGTILLGGRDISGLSEQDIARIAGYVPQIHAASFSFSVLDFVVMGCASRIGLFSKPGNAEKQAARDALTELGIPDLADKPYTQLSGGEQQKAVIARAIVGKPQIVLFDEPTAHLDYGNQLRVLRIIKSLASKGYSVVMTTHNPDHALLLGGRTALIDGEGRLVSGNTDQVVTQEALRKIYGADVLLHYIEGIGRNTCVYPSL